MVEPWQHDRWVENVEQHPNDHVILVMDGGYGRLTAKWELSFFVKPEYRGHHYGRNILKLLEDRSRNLPMIARVHPGNGASLGAFRSAGWRMSGQWSLLER